MGNIASTYKAWEDRQTDNHPNEDDYAQIIVQLGVGNTELADLLGKIIYRTTNYLPDVDSLRYAKTYAIGILHSLHEFPTRKMEALDLQLLYILNNLSGEGSRTEACKAIRGWVRQAHKIVKKERRKK